MELLILNSTYNLTYAEVVTNEYYLNYTKLNNIYYYRYLINNIKYFN